MKYKNNTRYKYQTMLTMLSKQQPKRKRASVTPKTSRLAAYSLVRRQFRQWETAKLNRANNIGVNSK